MHPVSLQKIHKGAHFWQAQSVAQYQDTQWRGRTLVSLQHNPQPTISRKTGNLPGWHSDKPDSCQGGTDQRIEVIGVEPRRNAHSSSCCPFLEAPFYHAWYVTEAQTVVLSQIVRRLWLAAPA